MPPVDGYTARTYGDAFADVYDDWYADLGDTSDAVATLVELAGGGAVLELGVGSGRLAVPIAAAGVDVWGLDSSPAMLDRLAARAGGDRVRAVLGDMTDPVAALDGAPPFAVVVCAFNTFFLLAGDGEQARCLQACSSLLADGGVVVLECFVPGESPPKVERVLETRTVAVDHVVLTATEHDPDRQLVRGQHIELREHGTRLRPWVLRYATPAQLDALADAAGLRLVDRWRGWDRRPLTDDDSMHVSVYMQR